MKIHQKLFLSGQWKDHKTDAGFEPVKSHLVLAFGSSANIVDPDTYSYLKNEYPNADVVLASTSGEIIGEGVYDESVVVTAVQFDKTRVNVVSTRVAAHNNSFDAGTFLMDRLADEDLNCVFLVSDGTQVNGSELVAGFNNNNKRNIPVTGGLAGDGARFAETHTGLNGVPAEGNIIAIGFYSESLLIGHGSFGGWDEFGHERTITRSHKNVLYEIDGKNALDLYKQYLGNYVNELPGSALLFPLSLRINGSEKNLVRTILSVNEEEKSMTFAGNLPEGSTVRLMKADFDKLIEASSIAANQSFASLSSSEPQLALLVSCVGRKLILQERTDEEIFAAKETLGDKTAITGFYSYGEISPFDAGSQCELHNQTMTITTLTEL